ncbi:MAG TPA: GTP 3',8-cyclase MoaA [Rhodanobacteraceae bacterium]|nr:GTP 3',8-cyclase MoaA [Rhodanobacteraceae bacterium]
MDAGKTPADVRAPRDQLARPLADLRISVIDHCNFRCPYCMPAEMFPDDHRFLSAAERLSFDEIERLTRVFAGLGVSKLRLTGGEPLLRKDLPQLVQRLAAINGIDDLALTTNGVLLPKLAQPLRDAGLRRVSISLDTLDAEVFTRLSGGRGRLADVLAGIAAAEQAGFGSIKLNCVVMRGVNDAGVLDLVEHFRHTPHVMRFIEFMDVGTMNRWRLDKVVPSAELVARIHARWPLLALPPRRAGETARRYAFADGAGEVGFISSVSAPFCGGCTRARLSADGHLFTCLFAARGTDLLTPLRQGMDDAALAALVAKRWLGRDDRYSELRSAATAKDQKHIEMFRIGG